MMVTCSPLIQFASRPHNGASSATSFTLLKRRSVLWVSLSTSATVFGSLVPRSSVAPPALSPASAWRAPISAPRIHSSSSRVYRGSDCGIRRSAARGRMTLTAVGVPSMPRVLLVPRVQPRVPLPAVLDGPFLHVFVARVGCARQNTKLKVAELYL